MNKYQDRNTIAKTTFWSTFYTVDDQGKKRLSLRAKRWAAIVSIHLLFFLSFKVDIQTLEGTLSGSRFLGFHLIDCFYDVGSFRRYVSYAGQYGYWNDDDRNRLFANRRTDVLCLGLPLRIAQ